MDQFNKLLKEFRDLQVLLVVPSDEYSSQISSELRRLGCEVKHFWPLPVPLPTHGDLIICELVPDIADCIPWLPGETPLPFVLHIPRSGEIDLKGIRDCAAHGLLHTPITEQSIVATLLHSLEQYRYEKRLLSRIYRLDDNLRSMRSVEQAKLILMEAKKIDESEAYSLLRRTSMKRRTTLGSIANAIVESHELLR